MREAPELEHDFHRYESCKDLEHPCEFDHSLQSLDLLLMVCKEFGWVYIGPELVTLAKGDLQFDRVCVMTLSGKHCEGVMEDVAAALNTLVEPVCTMFLFIDWYGVSLTAAVVYRVDERDIEFVWVLDEVVGARHAYSAVRLTPK